MVGNFKRYFGEYIYENKFNLHFDVCYAVRHF